MAAFGEAEQLASAPGPTRAMLASVMSGQVAVHASPIAAEVPQVVLGGCKQHVSLCVLVWDQL